MSWFTVVPLVSIVTGSVMLYLAVVDICNDVTKPNWRWWKSGDVTAYAIGFACVILTSLYALIHTSIWL